MLMSSPLFANAANKVLLLATKAVTPPTGVWFVNSPAAASALAVMVKIESIPRSTAKPAPVPSHTSVSAWGIISLIILLLSPL